MQDLYLFENAVGMTVNCQRWEVKGFSADSRVPQRGEICLAFPSNTTVKKENFCVDLFALGFYVLVRFLSVLVIPICSRLNWPALSSSFGRTIKYWWLICRQWNLLRGSWSLSPCLNRRVFDTIKLAYNPNRPDGQLKLTTSVFNRLWEIYQQSW